MKTGKWGLFEGVGRLFLDLVGGMGECAAVGHSPKFDWDKIAAGWVNRPPGMSLREYSTWVGMKVSCVQRGLKRMGVDTSPRKEAARPLPKAVANVAAVAETVAQCGVNPHDLTVLPALEAMRQKAAKDYRRPVAELHVDWQSQVYAEVAIMKEKGIRMVHASEDPRLALAGAEIWTKAVAAGRLNLGLPDSVSEVSVRGPALGISLASRPRKL